MKNLLVHMRKLRHGEEKWLVRGHAARAWDGRQVSGYQSWGFARDLTLHISSLLLVLACIAASHLRVVWPQNSPEGPAHKVLTAFGLAHLRGTL